MAGIRFTYCEAKGEGKNLSRIGVDTFFDVTGPLRINWNDPFNNSCLDNGPWSAFDLDTSIFIRGAGQALRSISTES